MKVLFDARWILVENRFDGVSRYSHELAWAMSRREDLQMIWLVHDDRQLAKLPAGEHVMTNDPNDPLAEFFTLGFKLNNIDCDVVYSPFFMMGTFGKRYKLVLTIHDLIYFRHRTPPHWLPWYVRVGWWLFHMSYSPLRFQLNAADSIATVSETARQELLAVKATRRDITTVSNATSDHFVDTEPRNHHASNEILYMGAFTPYKNVECLIDALALLPDVTLHLCGKMPPARGKVFEQRMRDKGVFERVIVHNGVDDETYKQLLRKVRCSVTASRHEGFGLPVIEAQQARVPVACSDTPIFREVAGESALFFSPDSPEQCADIIKQFADKQISDEYIARGATNVARYTWDNSAAVAAEICHNLTNNT